MPRFKKYVEEASIRDVPKEFMNDPLYKNVLIAKDEKEFKKRLNILLSVRGNDAVKILQNAIKGK